MPNRQRSLGLGMVAKLTLRRERGRILARLHKLKKRCGAELDRVNEFDAKNSGPRTPDEVRESYLKSLRQTEPDRSQSDARETEQLELRQALLSDAEQLKRGALDYLNRAGLSTNPVYRDVELTNLDQAVSGFYGGSFHARWTRNLCDQLAAIRHQLELTAGLPKSLRSVPRKASNRDPHFPAMDADSPGRAQTVARLVKELQRLPPRLNATDYDSLKARHSRFLVFYISEKWPEKAKLHVMNRPAAKTKPSLEVAFELASLYHSREPNTIQTDWKNHMPERFRRRR